MLDALRARKERFIFDNVDVALKASVMAFITMNPGYPGRAELPESLKACSANGSSHVMCCYSRRASEHTSWCAQALFRPCSMCVPDLSLIAVRRPCLLCMSDRPAYSAPANGGVQV